MNLNPTISIIVPVYKVEKYIGRCIDSILDQTYRNFELILIDDGTPDNSGKICDEYAGKDKRIKVIHKTNGGVSETRNLGISQAQGEWIYFVDSDDWIEKGLLAAFVNAMAENVDLYFVSHIIEIENSDTVERIYDDRIFDKKEDGIKYLYAKGGLGVTWNKLFRSRTIKEFNIRFDVRLNSYEDELFTLDYCRHAGKIRTIPYPGYHYMYASEGLSKRLLLPEERYNIALLLYKSMREISDEKDFVRLAKENFAYHLYDSFEQYYRIRPEKKLSARQKKKYLMMCYDLLRENDFCKHIIPGRKVINIKLIFSLKNWFVIDCLFKLNMLRLRLKSGKNI